MKRFRKIGIALVAVLLLVSIAFTAHALSSRSQLNSARKQALAFCLQQYPQAEKMQHRVLRLGNLEHLVLLNLSHENDTIYCAVQTGEDSLVTWSTCIAASSVSEETPLFYVSKNGECYHAKVNCSGMKNPLAAPQSISALLDEALRPCSHCVAKPNANNPQ